MESQSLAPGTVGRPPVENDDYKLIKLCLRGKKECFAQLVEKYSKRAYNLSYRLTSNPEKAKDIVQEAFIKIYKSLDKYDPSYKFSSWLLKTVSNLCIDYHRTRHQATASLEAILASGAESAILSDASSKGSTEEVIEERLESQELKRVIAEGMELLPMDYKSVLVLRHVQNLSYKEIAQMLGLPMGTIKARIFRARKLLKGFLESKLVQGPGT
jgi:RNA polymerase sigma-70 factor (ECF subfamily)